MNKAFAYNSVRVVSKFFFPLTSCGIAAASSYHNHPLASEALFWSIGKKTNEDRN
jgi:hypothetical protein